MTADTLVRDVGATLQGVLREVGCPTVRLVLAGHSLGGAIAVRAAHAISSGMFEEGFSVFFVLFSSCKHPFSLFFFFLLLAFRSWHERNTLFVSSSSVFCSLPGLFAKNKT